MVSTRRAVSPGHVLGLAAVRLAPRGGAPQPGAGGHVGAGGGPGPEHQLTLPVRVIAQPGQAGEVTVSAGVQPGQAGLVSQALTAIPTRIKQKSLNI